MAVKSVKTDWVRVAVSGPTVDARAIKPAWLTQAAKNFNLVTYQPRINLNHIRPVSSDGPFKMLGSVIDLKAEPFKLNVSGEEREETALYAKFELSPEAVEMKSRGQALNASIEIAPEFGGSKEAGLLGLALTDNPASLGTQQLSFATSLTNNFYSDPLAVDAFDVIEQADEPSSSAVSAFTSFINTITAAIKPAAAAAPVVAAAEQPAEMAALSALMVQGFASMGAALKEVTDNFASLSTDLKSVREETATLKSQMEATAAPGQAPRKPAAGGNFAMTDC